MFTKAFWYAVLERMLKTFAQTELAVVGVGAADVASVDVLHMDWRTDLIVGGVAAGLSLLTSVASAGAGHDGPSLATETTVATSYSAQQVAGNAEVGDDGLEPIEPTDPPEDPANADADISSPTGVS